jgi:N-acetylglucosaminyldiphosphoundecaprenol N-acetyl-beta-D-mannosaminyltransferase
MRNEFLSISFNLFTIEELADRVFNNDGFLWIVTPNVDHVVRYHRNSEFSNCYDKSDIIVNDSKILDLLSKMKGVNIGNTIPGSDLTSYLMNSPKMLNKKITIIGCSDSTISSIKNKYKCGDIFHYNPPMGFINDENEVESCLDFIKENPSQIVFLCVGSPRQEYLALRIKNSGCCNSAVLCVGASFLFLSGEEKRAPLILRKLSLEWLFRLVLNPKRMAKRYLIDGPVIFKIYIYDILKSFLGK